MTKDELEQAVFTQELRARLLVDYPIFCARVAEQGFTVIESVYPERWRESVGPLQVRDVPGKADEVVLHAGSSDIILAVDVKSLLSQASRADGVVELAARVGDFVACGQPLFRLYGGARTISPSELSSSVASGRERTIEQDPTFAFRVIVDIATKALSKAINDATTAVLAIDQLHRLLTTVGGRDLRNEYLRDGAGRLRVIFPTPDWEDFVQLTCREIRIYGAENLQIARRLHAMIDNLENGLPESRKQAFRAERDLLDRMIDKAYLLPEDAALARIADTQGLGGSVNE